MSCTIELLLRGSSSKATTDPSLYVAMSLYAIIESDHATFLVPPFFSLSRHPVPSGRLTFVDIVFRLSYTEDILLQWDHMDATMQEAATLGASLSLGKSLHTDLQVQYLKPT